MESGFGDNIFKRVQCRTDQNAVSSENLDEKITKDENVDQSCREVTPENVVKLENTTNNNEDNTNEAQNMAESSNMGNENNVVEGSENEAQVKIENHDENVKDNNQINVSKVEKPAEANENNLVYKKKLNADGRIVRVILSEGEVSSGFESVSSVDSTSELSTDERIVSYKNCNFDAKIENEKAFQNYVGSKSPNQAIPTSSEDLKEAGDKKRIKLSPTHNNCNEDRTFEDRRFERDVIITSHNDKTSDERLLIKTKSPEPGPSRRSNSLCRRRSRSRSRRKSDRQGRRRSRSSRRKKSKSRGRRSRSRGRRSRSFDKKKESSRSSSPYFSKIRKKTGWGCRDVGSFKTKFFERRSVRGESRHNTKSRYHYKVREELDFTRDYSPSSENDSSPRAKSPDTTIIIIDSPERSVKNEDGTKVKPEENRTEVSLEVTNESPASTLPETENRVLPGLPELKPSIPSQVSNYCGQMPTVSVDNLPLVPGPTGLPIHISPKGEIIPHDMSGRRIPIGPNGHYLPLDPSGRLFPHIVTPDNTAVPVYITEDGVLRLPNSQPVPFGTPHKLPVNIDGKMILIGPDSRPLVPCLNLPSHPPIYIQQVTTAQLPSFSGKQNQETNSEPPSQSGESSQTEKTSNKKKEFEKFSSNEEMVVCSTSSDPQGSVLESEVIVNVPQNTRNGSSVKELIDSVDEHLLRKLQELSKNEKSSDDPVVNENQSGLETSNKQNVPSSTFGRFIIPKKIFKPRDTNTKFESPLWINRVQLPFITPRSKINGIEDDNLSERSETSEIISVKNSYVNSTHYQGIDELKVERSREIFQKPLTVDFGVQCDLAKNIVDQLNSTISKLRKEVFAYQTAYSDLLRLSRKSDTNRGKN